MFSKSGYYLFPDMGDAAWGQPQKYRFFYP